MIVFFFPYELNATDDRPSLKRPLKMLDALKKIAKTGQVLELIGSSRDLKIKRIQPLIKNDPVRAIEFVYVESINKPLFLQRIFERKINIFGDYCFFWQCKKHNIPLTMFYRDALWVSKQFRDLTPKYTYYFLKVVFYIEFKVFEYLFDVLFLPSIEMAKVLPLGENKVVIDELPPAVDLDKYQFVETNKPKKNQGIVLLYVGNINPGFYNISPMVKVLENDTSLKLNLCCRKQDWNLFKQYYNFKYLKNVYVHHLVNDELERIYRQSDVHILLFAEEEYRKFAVPFKFYESLQFGIPIITNKGTKVASLVREMDVGWVVNNQAEVSKLIVRLNSDMSLVQKKKDNIARVIKANSWKARIEKVIKICTSSSYKISN